jgi:hypothetical protein
MTMATVRLADPRMTIDDSAAVVVGAYNVGCACSGVKTSSILYEDHGNLFQTGHRSRCNAKAA